MALLCAFSLVTFVFAHLRSENASPRSGIQLPLRFSFPRPLHFPLLVIPQRGERAPCAARLHSPGRHAFLVVGWIREWRGLERGHGVLEGTEAEWRGVRERRVARAHRGELSGCRERE